MQPRQIIATSHDLTPNGGLVSKGNLPFSGKSGLVKYNNLARYSPFMYGQRGHFCIQLPGR